VRKRRNAKSLIRPKRKRGNLDCSSLANETLSTLYGRTRHAPGIAKHILLLFNALGHQYFVARVEISKMSTTSPIIRPLHPDDTETLISLADSTRVFKPMEIDVLREVLEGYHEGNEEEGHRSFVMEEEGTLLGFAYYGPEVMTENTWTLWWIAVSPQLHGKGLGKALLRFVEEDVRELEGRVLFIETSSLPSYEATRQFYSKQGYTIDGQLKGFYASGDDKIIFRKEIAILG
jgi:GNAT superfamily N-acetyltransferase